MSIYRKKKRMEEHGRSFIFTKVVKKEKKKKEKKRKCQRMGVRPGYLEERALARKRQ